MPRIRGIGSRRKKAASLPAITSAVAKPIFRKDDEFLMTLARRKFPTVRTSNEMASEAWTLPYPVAWTNPGPRAPESTGIPPATANAAKITKNWILPNFS
jgi:hypothetical protein